MKNILLGERFEFVHESMGGANFYFSTAYNEISFKIDENEGILNIDKLKEIINLKEIKYLKQLHSDIIKVNPKSEEIGDAIICKEKNIGIGVFTADCAPILIFDKDTKAMAAVHSGWRGTYKLILLKTLQKMKEEYGTKAENIIAYIGPHNGVCCYEVGQGVNEEFKKEDFYKNKNIFEGKNLNITDCLRYQLHSFGVLDHNILDSNLCTYCAKDYKLHSYRKTGVNSGRLFSFLYYR
ncbi:peptidoglycan editing factor PgeF [Clostridium algidicarnis]|uniref:peptidoglycan editing factor PgeF n=1 Tax=Clostridium algidicarnis TaxID=37659 RepID=UPI001C0DE741|nr:peptidoglycan editing factor PgeF [Clostridium algidicarnis]MBU3226831.1 peptidoglycan editing factor PgeF [Clostridium algidicarnis]MBU3250258.1 peptidoglycan editing factor PgeF [Clostridium algidicarnis]